VGLIVRRLRIFAPLILIHLSFIGSAIAEDSVSPFTLNENASSLLEKLAATPLTVEARGTLPRALEVLSTLNNGSVASQSEAVLLDSKAEIIAKYTVSQDGFLRPTSPLPEKQFADQYRLEIRQITDTGYKVRKIYFNTADANFQNGVWTVHISNTSDINFETVTRAQHFAASGGT